MPTVAQIEAAAHRALAGERVERHGWVLRIAPEQRSRRANSATTPVTGVVAPGAVDDVLAWYRARQAPPLIRVLSTSDPDVDRHLDAAGWHIESLTQLLVRSVEPASTPGTVVTGRPPPEWLAMRARFGDPSHGVLGLESAGGEHEFGYVVTSSSVGRAVRDRDLVGVLDVATLPGLRRSGGATGVMAALMAWGASRGAETCWLQVQSDNAPALALYARLGFHTEYEYWYRRWLAHVPPSEK